MVTKTQRAIVTELSKIALEVVCSGKMLTGGYSVEMVIPNPNYFDYMTHTPRGEHFEIMVHWHVKSPQDAAKIVKTHGGCLTEDEINSIVFADTKGFLFKHNFGSDDKAQDKALAYYEYQMKLLEFYKKCEAQTIEFD